MIIAISGPIAVGKSAFIEEIVQQTNAMRVSTRNLIQSLRDVPSERGALQDAGEDLDRATDGAWVSDSLADHMHNLGHRGIVVVDSVRIAKQVEHLRSRFGNRVRHVHLTASYDVLVLRFQQRKERGGPAVRDCSTYDEALANPTEASIERLGEIADLEINTDSLRPSEIAAYAIERLGLLPGE